MKADDTVQAAAGARDEGDALSKLAPPTQPDKLIPEGWANPVPKREQKPGPVGRAWRRIWKWLAHRFEGLPAWVYAVVFVAGAAGSALYPWGVYG